jgi:hypothetical protein
MPEIFKMCLELSSAFMKPRQLLVQKSTLTTKVQRRCYAVRCNREVMRSNKERIIKDVSNKSNCSFKFTSTFSISALCLRSFASLHSVVVVKTFNHETR